MVRTFSDSKNIYSVDMMIAYVNINKPKALSIKLTKKEVENILKNKCWGEPNGKRYSPLDVIQNPKKYKEDYERIKEANLKYPIILHYHSDGQNLKTKEKIIIDGVHRLCKMYILKENMENLDTLAIKAYIFDKKVMKLFLLGKTSDREKVRQMETWEYLILFHNRISQK